MGGGEEGGQVQVRRGAGGSRRDEGGVREEITVDIRRLFFFFLRVVNARVFFLSVCVGAAPVGGGGRRPQAGAARLCMFPLAPVLCGNES